MSTGELGVGRRTDWRPSHLAKGSELRAGSASVDVDRSATGTRAGPRKATANDVPDVVRLRDGSHVSIRAITPDDRREIADAFTRLSPESRYRRFLHVMGELDERTLGYLTEIDHHDHEAVAAFDTVDEHGVGIARYVRTQADAPSAEIAVLVADDWQGRGVGTVLLERVVARARAEGVHRLEALVLASNGVMIKLLEEHGWTMSTLPQGGTVEMILDDLADHSADEGGDPP